MKKGLIIFGIFIGLLVCTLLVIFPVSDSLQQDLPSTGGGNGDVIVDAPSTPVTPNPKPNDPIRPEPAPDDDTNHPATDFTDEDGVVHTIIEYDGQPATCTEIGWYSYKECSACDYTTYREIPASGHDFDIDSSDYMIMVTCGNDGCDYTIRQDGNHTYDDLFVYDFTATEKAEIEANIQEFYNQLDYVGPYNSAYHGYDENSELNDGFATLLDLFWDFNHALDRIGSQYQNAYVLYYIEISEENAQNYAEINGYYNEKIAEYYLTFRLIYDSAYREYFVEHFGEDNALYYVSVSDSYSDGSTADINKRLGEIQVEFMALEDETVGDTVPTLYEEFVDLNNQLAEIYGYENYLNYAYLNEYNRSYTPEDAKMMRSYVKNYISEIYHHLYSNLEHYKTVAMSYEAYEVYTALTNSVFFDSKIANNLVHDYFVSMSTTEDSSDFFECANSLFREGNYYRGERDGAFSWSIDSLPFVYFGPGTYYSGAFTFVHEFGHHYNNVSGTYNSMDTAEIHSQGNEMMFLAYLENNLPANILNDMYARLYFNELTGIIGTILMSSCVDEFEYCVYTGTTPDGQPATYTAEDYDDLFVSIMQLYGIESTFRHTYWRSVTIQQACYYISYAISALPSVEIFSIAGTEGYETAKEIYFNTQFLRNANYGAYLVEAGLTSVFDENLYIDLLDTFVNTEKDFAY